MYLKLDLINHKTEVRPEQVWLQQQTLSVLKYVRAHVSLIRDYTCV